MSLSTAFLVAFLLSKALVAKLFQCRCLVPDSEKKVLALSSQAALRCECTNVRHAAAEVLRVCAQQNCALDNVKV